MLPIKRLALLTLAAVLPASAQIITGGGGGGGGGGNWNSAQVNLGSITGAVNLTTVASTNEAYNASSMTGNVVFSWLPGPPSAGAHLHFALTEDATGFRSCTFPAGFTNAFDCSKAGPGVTVNIDGNWNGTAFEPSPTFSTFSAGICIETGAPVGNPPSGVIWTWCDATLHTFESKNSSGVITGMVSIGNGVFAALDQTAGNAIWAQLNPTTSNVFTAGKTNVTTDSATTAAVRMTGTAAPSSPVAGDLGMSLLGNLNFWDGAIRHWPLSSSSENPCTATNMLYTSTTTPSIFACDPNIDRINPGEITLYQAATASTSRAILSFGATPASSTTIRKYINCNSPSSDTDCISVQMNGIQMLRVQSAGQPNNPNIVFANSGEIIGGFNGGGRIVDVSDIGGGSAVTLGIGQNTAEGITMTGDTGLVTKYATLTTAGMGVPPVYATSSLTAQVASIGSTNLQCGGAICPAGQYRLYSYIASTVSCGTPGPAAIQLNLTWTDDAGLKSNQVIPLDDNNATTLSATLALGTTTGYAQGHQTFWSTGAANISYSTTYTACSVGTGTYSIRNVLERLQ